MKSKEILPPNKRLSELDISQLEGFGYKSSNVNTYKLILEYHKALKAAEAEIEALNKELDKSMIMP